MVISLPWHNHVRLHQSPSLFPAFDLDPRPTIPFPPNDVPHEPVGPGGEENASGKDMISVGPNDGPRMSWTDRSIRSGFGNRCDVTQEQNAFPASPDEVSSFGHCILPVARPTA